MEPQGISAFGFCRGAVLPHTAIGAPATQPLRPATLPDGTARWLDGVPTRHEGVSWGQAWPRGTRIARDYRLVGDGAAQTLQSWPLAYWPDGSIKWTGHAAPADTGIAAGLRVDPGRGRSPAGAV